MKIIILSLLLSFSFLTSIGQNRSSRSDSTKKTYNSEKYKTDSVKRGNELYEGGRGHKGKSQGDTLRGSKNRVGAKQTYKINQVAPQQASSGSVAKKNHAATTSHKRIVLAMNDL